MTLLIDALLALLVAATWLGCLGFARLRDPLDRLHCAAFVNAAAGLLLAATAFAADGASIRAFKILLTVAISLLAGAALSHAVGRSLLYRSRFPAPATAPAPEPAPKPAPKPAPNPTTEDA